MPVKYRQMMLASGLLLSCFGILYINSQNSTQESTSIPDINTRAITAYSPPGNKPLIHTVITKENPDPRWVNELEESSLAGSTVDRATVSTRDGKIVLNGGILVYFDYFLSLEGEMSKKRIMELVWQDMQENFTPDIASQLYNLFERYVSYLATMSRRLDELTYETVKAEGINAQSLAREVRAQFFTNEEIATLFGNYERMLTFRSNASYFQEKFEAYGKVDDEFSAAMATELFGVEAASRFQQLHQERKQWRERIANYLTEKGQILQSPDIADMDKHSAIQDLLKRHFSIHEQVRVKVLENQNR